MRSKLIPFIFLGLTPMAANAADLARNNYARAYPPASFNWTGLYAGVHLGYGWNTSNRDTFVSTTGAFYSSSIMKSDGVYGGIQLGYNRQIGQWVVGWEADLSLANINNGKYHPQLIQCLNFILNHPF